ncbi:MAG: DUF4177 domain-containing protein [Desulforhopalus sp.]|nr:DUF4177 domain-containing protein [Desulforhopalus sp.]
MRWSYKTVHYELKKEGLLGSAFLDESEVELSLNEYGKAGWELVSILETQDGLIAIFKQPLGVDCQAEDDEEDERQYVVVKRQQDDLEPPQYSRKNIKKPVLRESPIEPVDDYEIVVDEPVREVKKSPPVENDIGAIRIE